MLTVSKHCDKPTRWAIMDGGKPLEHDGITYQYFRTRKEAAEKLPELEGQLAYEARILADDAAGVIAWLPAEEAEIQAYAAKLRAVRFLEESRPLVQEATKEEEWDAHALAAWDSHGPDAGCVIRAEIRRRRAGRKRAFDLAGVTMPEVCK